MKIIELRIENVQRVRAVTIRPLGKSSTVIVGGANAQGKTSVLDAIQMALGGARAMSAEPIRRGAKQASIVADLGELVVERVITKSGTTLTVRDRDGHKKRAPQEILDALCSKVSFDPLEFSRQDPRKQNETLRKLIPALDFSALDAEREKLYSKRTETGKDAKRVRAHADSIPVTPSMAAEPIQISDLLAELRQAQTAHQTVTAAQGQLSTAQARLAAADDEYARAEAAFRQAESKRAGARLALKAGERAVAEASADLPDLAAIEVRIRNAEAINRNAQRRAERDGHEKRAGELDAEVDALTKQIEAIDQRKVERLSAAAFPVPGLGMTEDGPTLEGVPLAQASGAQKLRVSVAIGLALNPKVKVLLVRDASLLDDAHLRLIEEMADAADAQIWLERVGKADPCAVVICDGQVDENAPANDAVAAALPAE